MRAAISALKKSQPAKIIVAVPVGSPDICIEIRKEVDELVCLSTPEPFYSVGTWYEDFPQTSDNEVLELLQRARI
jgi:putative phosphoribosyl transferase